MYLNKGVYLNAWVLKPSLWDHYHEMQLLTLVTLSKQMATAQEERKLHCLNMLLQLASVNKHTHTHTYIHTYTHTYIHMHTQP